MPHQGLEIDAIGQYAVLDCFDGRMTLLAVGDRELGGASPRDRLDRRSRLLLLNALKGAVLAKKPRVARGNYDGSVYDIAAHPILTPDRSTAIGAYGAFVAEGGLMPPPPLIGSWQWSVDRQTGESFASQWDAGLHALHEYEPTGEEGPAGPAAFWFTHLVPEADRARLLPLINEGVRAADGRRQLLSFDGITRYGTENPGRKHLAIAANALPEPGCPRGAVMRGFTRQVPEPAGYAPSGIDAVGAEEMMDAVLALVDCCAVAALDILRGRVFMRGIGWEQCGLRPGFSGDLTALAEPRQKRAFDELLAQAASATGRRGPMPVTLTGVGGKRLGFQATAMRLDRDQEPARYLIVVLTPDAADKTERER